MCVCMCLCVRVRVYVCLWQTLPYYHQRLTSIQTTLDCLRVEMMSEPSATDHLLICIRSLQLA